MTSMRIPSPGYPMSYPQMAARACDACLATGRGHVVMRPFLMRAADEDHGSLVLACPRCQHQVIASEAIPLEVLSRPSGKLFSAT